MDLIWNIHKLSAFWQAKIILTPWHKLQVVQQVWDSVSVRKLINLLLIVLIIAIIRTVHGCQLITSCEIASCREHFSYLQGCALNLGGAGGKAHH